MNIFVLDPDPEKAASMLCDCHVRKMCLETAQILSGVMIRRGIELREGMPKPQNINHPVIMAADNPESMIWLPIYNDYLLYEYRFRFGKDHAYYHIAWLYAFLLDGHVDISKRLGDMCNNLAKCCGDLDVSDIDIVTAYRKYYTEVKKPTLIGKNLWKFTKREDWTNV